MAEVFHRYVPSPKKRDEVKEQAALSYLKERERAARAKRRESEIRIAEKQKLLIPRELATKQAAYLLISLRQRLLAIPSCVTREMRACPDDRAAEMFLDREIRNALDEVSAFPEKVTSDWRQQLDEHESASAKRVVK